jgi:hypothetical protein
VTLARCPAKAEQGPAPSGAVVRVAPLSEEFEVAVAVAVPYAELKARVAPLLVGRSFGEGGRTLTLDGLDLGDAGGRVLVRVPVRGALTGTLYLWGTPAVVEENRRWVLRVPDLQVALESRSFLQQILLFAWSLKDGGLEAMMKAKLTVDVTDRLAEVRAALSGRHELASGPPTPVLTTTLTGIRPGEVESRPGALVLHPLLVGRADLTIETGPAPK